MTRFYKYKENLNFISYISFILTFFSFLTYISFNQSFNQSFYQLSYLSNSKFKWTFITSEKMPTNSFLNLESRQSFFVDTNLSIRIQSSSLMITDAEYLEDSILNSSNLILGKVSDIQKDEIVITQEISKYYDLSIDSNIYTKSIVTSSKLIYKVVGIINNIYSVNSALNNNFKGLLFFGYDSLIESNIIANYQTFTNQDPSSLLLSCQGCLIKIYSLSELSQISIEKLFYYSVLFSLVIIPFVLVLYNYLMKDGFSYYKRLVMIGSSKLFIGSFITRTLMFILLSIFLMMIFSILSSLFINISFVSFFWVLFISLLFFPLFFNGCYLIKRMRNL